MKKFALIALLALISAPVFAVTPWDTESVTVTATVPAYHNVWITNYTGGGTGWTDVSTSTEKIFQLVVTNGRADATLQVDFAWETNEDGYVDVSFTGDDIFSADSAFTPIEVSKTLGNRQGTTAVGSYTLSAFVDMNTDPTTDSKTLTVSIAATL